MTDCLFCKIVAKDIPSQPVFDNEHVYAFMDIRPTNEGHVLIVPKKHSTDIFDTSAETLGQMMSVAKTLSAAVSKAVNADGINILMNNKGAAGQIIFHAHIHVVPRFSYDGFKHWKGKEMTSEQLEATATKIREVL